jgi:hypothetical protein
VNYDMLPNLAQRGSELIKFAAHDNLVLPQLAASSCRGTILNAPVRTRDSACCNNMLRRCETVETSLPLLMPLLLLLLLPPTPLLQQLLLLLPSMH